MDLSELEAALRARQRGQARERRVALLVGGGVVLAVAAVGLYLLLGRA